MEDSQREAWETGVETTTLTRDSIFVTDALKDEALRQAKLNYLKRNKGQAAHPFFWAGFIGIGDMALVRK